MDGLAGILANLQEAVAIITLRKASNLLGRCGIVPPPLFWHARIAGMMYIMKRERSVVKSFMFLVFLVPALLVLLLSPFDDPK